MPAATPEPIRQQVWQAAQQGQQACDIAQSLQLPVRTVRHLLARFRADGQPSPPGFDRCGRRTTAAFGLLREQAVDLRRKHPRWGAGRIDAHWRCLDLADLPDASTVRRWLAAAGLAPPRRLRPGPATPAPVATHPHQVWPMDACEHKPLRDPGHKVCWLRLLDEASGAALFTQVFDRPCWGEVGANAVQAALRLAFDRWGRPDGLRVDNGQPWVSPDSDLPSDLELWLGGLGVALHKGRPHIPQDNPRMERSQRTAQDWGEPWQHDTAEQLQARLDEEDRIHRQVYLFDGERTRAEAYPELAWRGRPYAALPYWEEVCWDHRQALGLLGRLELQRKVYKDGGVSMYDHHHRVGYAYRGQVVHLRFCPDGQEWVFFLQGQEVSRAPAPYLDADRICALRLCRRPQRKAIRTQRRRAAKRGPAATPPPTTPAPS